MLSICVFLLVYFTFSGLLEFFFSLNFLSTGAKCQIKVFPKIIFYFQPLLKPPRFAHYSKTSQAEERLTMERSKRAPKLINAIIPRWYLK